MQWRRTGLWEACMAAAGVLAAILTPACGDDTLTELVVVVETDLAVPGTLETVALTVVGPSGDTAYDDTVDLRASDAPDMPLTLSLTPGSGDLSPVAIEALGSLANGSTVRVRVRTGFVKGERRAVVLRLRNACVGKSCPDGETCGASGECVSAERPAESLPPWTGEPPPAPDAGTMPDGGTLDAGADAGGDGGDAGTDGGTTDGGGDAGECSVDTDCDPDIRDEGPCENFSSTNVCDETGTRSVDVTSFSCFMGSCVSSTNTITEGCMRDTDDDPCIGERLCGIPTVYQCVGGSCQPVDDPCPAGCFCDTSTDTCLSETEPGALCALQEPI